MVALQPAGVPRIDARETPTAPATGVVTVDGWLRHAWDEAVQVDRLEDLQALRVETENSTYDIAIAEARNGDVLIRGGRYFPGWTSVQLLGCSLGGGLLKRHAVHVGFRKEVYWEGRIVITSPVRAITLAPAAGSYQ